MQYPVPGERPAITVKSDFDRFDEWQTAFDRHGIDAIRWEHREQHLDRIRFALVWQPEPYALSQLPGLEVIFSVGAGIDHLKGENLVPEGIPVVRMVEDTLTSCMVEYVVWHTLGFHRNLIDYMDDQREHRWDPRVQRETSSRTVGILGLGVLGGAAGQCLRQFGFNVIGWSRTEKNQPGIESYFGDQQLGDFLGKTDILVCLLPNTPATAGIINRQTLGQLREGAFFINAGRGAAVNDADLIEALGNGRLRAAALDVFNEEPLPKNSPYWDLKNVIITPHVASMTQHGPSANHVATNIHRYIQGEPLTHVADLGRGY